MYTTRRTFLTGVLLLLAAPALAHPGPHRHPHRRLLGRRLFRRRLRRVRRRVLWRSVAGRRVLVVPLALAVGWELMVDEKPVVVHEVHEHHVVVKHADGKTEKLEIAKEDTVENSQELEGSEYEDESEAEAEGE